MSRRREGNRVLLIPNQWDGSVQHYYHFLLGYLMPAALRIKRKKLREVTVRDCGPMNRWFEPLSVTVDVEIMNVGHVLHSFAGKMQPYCVLPTSDDPARFKARDIQEFTEMYRELLEIRPNKGFARHITVIDRRVSDPHFHAADTEAPNSGAERRSIPNLIDIVNGLPYGDVVGTFDAAEVEIRNQLSSFSTTRLLVGQHGAGLANMIWMKTGGSVVEILPPGPSHSANIFRNLSQVCGLNYEAISQESDHAPVNEQELVAAVKRGYNA